MKQIFLKTAAFCSLVLATVPLTAQEKAGKGSKDVQTIIITRKGDTNEKTVVEIKGDKVLINGKESDKGDDVSVKVHKIKTGDHAISLKGADGRNFNFNFDDKHFQLFAEDSNRAMLGIETDMDEKGAEVIHVNKESAAEKAGLKKGDIITQIDDKKINDAEDVSKAVRSHKPGDKININILRDGKEQKLTAVLGRWKGIRMNNFSPERFFGGNAFPPEPPIPPIPDRFFLYDNNRPKLGISIQDTDDGKGVTVLDVEDDSNAFKAGLKKDDIIIKANDRTINTTDEMTRFLRENKDKTNIKLQVLRNGKEQTVEVKMPRKLKTADL